MGRWRYRAFVWGLWGAAVLLACMLPSCAWSGSAPEAIEAAPSRPSDGGRPDWHVGEVIEAEGIAEAGPEGPQVTSTYWHKTFRLADLLQWPTDVARKRVLLTGRLVRVPGEPIVNESLSRFGPLPEGLELREITWRVLEPSAMEDGAAPFRLASETQFGAHMGERVAVEGIAEDQKPGAVVTTSFYSFELNDLGLWPEDVPRRKVLVTGRLVLNPGTPDLGKWAQFSRRPPYIALDEVRWKLWEPSPDEARAETPFRLTSEDEIDAHVGKLVTLQGTAQNLAGGACVSAVGTNGFRLKSLAGWPAGVEGKRVLVTGRLIVNPGAPEEVRAAGAAAPQLGPRPPGFALDGAIWRVIESG